MPDLDTAIRAAIDEITVDPYSTDHRGYDALRAVLDLCSAYKDKAETMGDPFPKVPVAQLRAIIARKLGVPR